MVTASGATLNYSYDGLNLFGNISISLGGSVGVGAHFDSSFSGITVGTAVGLGFVFSVNWGVVSEGISSEIDSNKRRVE